MVPKSLAMKMIKVMSSTKRVAKNGQNDFHKYSYVREADVLETVREALIENNVFIFSSVEATHKDGDLTSVVMKHTFVDGDTGETFEVKSFGQGADKSGDKGGPKAITSAIKYLLMKNLLLPTGDDPEATDENGKATADKTTVASIERPKRYKNGFAAQPKVVESGDVDGEF